MIQVQGGEQGQQELVPGEAQQVCVLCGQGAGEEGDALKEGEGADALYYVVEVIH